MTEAFSGTVGGVGILMCLGFVVWFVSEINYRRRPRR